MKRFSLRAAAVSLAAATIAVGGCNPSDKLLAAPDPDLINPADVNSAAGADALRAGAINRLRTMTAGGPANGESTWLLGGLLTDEYQSGDTFTERDETDKRTIQLVNGNVNTAYRSIHRTRVAAIIAIRALRQYNPTATADIGEMYMVKGYAELSSGEHFCNGQPFSDASGDVLALGTPVSTEDAFKQSLATLDSGLAVVGTATTTKAVQIRNAINTLRGRVLLDLGRFADAGTAVGSDATGVPTTSIYQISFAQTSGDNRIWELTVSAGRYTVADRDGTNGLPFVSARDPRVPTCTAETRAPGNTAPFRCALLTSLPNKPPRVSFDGATPLNAQLIWPTRESSVTVVGGVEARLIEAEAALRAGNPAGMLAVLNALRANTALYQCAAATYGSIPGDCTNPPTALAPMTDPGTDAGRQNLLFNERAFWLFSTGHRLGDLRRLIRQYGRDQAAVFPTGTFTKSGGTYGTDVNLPVVQAEENNPNFKGCTDRNA